MLGRRGDPASHSTAPATDTPVPHAPYGAYTGYVPPGASVGRLADLPAGLYTTPGDCTSIDAAALRL